MPYEEHQKSYKIETFDGFSTFKIMESPKRTSNAEVSEDTELSTLPNEQLSGGETVS